MLPPGDIIQRHRIHFHCYADDTQLNLSMNPDQTEVIAKLDIWMSTNFLHFAQILRLLFLVPNTSVQFSLFNIFRLHHLQCLQTAVVFRVRLLLPCN